MMTSVANPDLTLRVRPNKNSQVINKHLVPTSLQFAKPDGNHVIKPIHFTGGFCAMKQGGNKYKAKQYVFIRNSGCDGSKKTTQWWYDERTKQIKNQGGRGWCWSVNPSSKKVNYVRMVRCREPRITLQDDGRYVAKSQANTMFNWSPEGFLVPARNDRIILQMVKNKRIAAIDKWKSGWSYRVGEVIA